MGLAPSAVSQLCRAVLPPPSHSSRTACSSRQPPPRPSTLGSSNSMPIQRASLSLASTLSGVRMGKASVRIRCSWFTWAAAQMPNPSVPSSRSPRWVASHLAWPTFSGGQSWVVSRLMGISNGCRRSIQQLASITTPLPRHHRRLTRITSSIWPSWLLTFFESPRALWARSLAYSHAAALASR